MSQSRIKLKAVFCLYWDKQQSIDFLKDRAFFHAAMSDEHNDSSHPVLAIIGKIFIFAIPASLVVMLGIVGAAFLGGSGVEVAQASAKLAPAVAVESSAAPAAEPAVAATSAVAAGAGSNSSQMQLGKAAYATCAACHGPDGAGLKAGPMLMAPSLHGSELLLGDVDAALLIILKGIAKEGMDYMGMMASLGAGLDDEKMAAVLTYTRNSWGNSAPSVTVEEAAAARAKFAAVNAPAGVRRAEIQAIVDAHK